MIAEGEVRPEGCICEPTKFGYIVKLEGYTTLCEIPADKINID
uniref:Uncharacterized protein n=1 Tax=Candidatus Methanophaga sp. ANME-1 ERB7 TaxID=2759913 RepID=A0A7G9Z4U8_9EURY|nr:hypothetical protein NKHFOMCA_00025 [Methanosarcinales archaeon ANME-1 ERB7]QNO57480.1 hypothetical protein PBOADKMI_00025 [Methanosarcinales archaeon ANME-1 ERB7]